MQFKCCPVVVVVVLVMDIESKDIQKRTDHTRAFYLGHGTVFAAPRPKADWTWSNIYESKWAPSFLHSTGHTHTTALCSMVVCVPTDSDAGPDDSRRVGNVILPQLYHPLRLCNTRCLVVGAISCCLPAAIVGNNEFSRIRPSFGNVLSSIMVTPDGALTQRHEKACGNFPFTGMTVRNTSEAARWMNVVGRIVGWGWIDTVQCIGLQSHV